MAFGPAVFPEYATYIFWGGIVLVCIGLFMLFFWTGGSGSEPMPENGDEKRPLWRIRRAGKVTFEDHEYNGDRPYLDSDSIGELSAKKIRVRGEKLPDEKG